jgi:hypothetical protein
LLSQDFEFTNHALKMLEERNIPPEWVMLALESPDQTEIGADNNVHYIKKLHEFGPRTFRVIVNATVTPNRVITFFFDRRLRTPL